MHFIKPSSRLGVIAYGFATLIIAVLSLGPRMVVAAEAPTANKSGSGTFVSFQDGKLTIQGKSGLLVYEQVGENYRTYQNNEEGPGSKLVGTVEALTGSKLPGTVNSLSRVLPGTVVQVNVEDREISFGLDHRVIGTLVSYQDGELKLLTADAAPGFIRRQIGEVTLKIDPSTPVLESVAGDDLKIAGSAGKVLKTVKPGAAVTARSEYDVDVVEVIEIGKPRRRMERYIGQTRGPVRGTFESFNEGILRIRGKGVASAAANEYERTIAWRIPDDVRIFESIDGGDYQPASADALKTVKEGTVITIRKIQDVLLDVRIGVAKQDESASEPHVRLSSEDLR